MALINFNAHEVQPNTPMDAIPAGEYKVEITDTEMKPTKTGGEYLQLTLRVTEGNFANRLIWDRLNLVNANATAQSIAMATLSQICHATGQMNINDSSQLHNIPLVAKVVVKDNEQYGPKNEVKGYKSAGVAAMPGAGAMPGKQAGQPHPNNPPAAQASPSASASHSSPPYAPPAGQPAPAWSRA
ncbi:hypothetical protein A3765_10615 [Oleiphilus sp. HI0130]|nr:hypothetical protein A3765_10615 [Oleiphilus sp. HI0130]